MADVFDGLETLLMVLAIFTAIFASYKTIMALTEPKATTHRSTTRALFWYTIPICLGILVSAIPEKETIYMIAASEIGESVIIQPENREIMKNLRDLINEKIKAELSSYTDKDV